MIVDLDPDHVLDQDPEAIPDLVLEVIILIQAPAIPGKYKIPRVFMRNSHKKFWRVACKIIRLYWVQTDFIINSILYFVTDLEVDQELDLGPDLGPEEDPDQLPDLQISQDEGDLPPS